MILSLRSNGWFDCTCRGGLDTLQERYQRLSFGEIEKRISGNTPGHLDWRNAQRRANVKWSSP